MEKQKDYLRTRSEKHGSMQIMLVRLDEGRGEDDVFRSLITIKECLFRSFTEQFYHMGELTNLIWQEDVEAQDAVVL